MKVKPEIKYRSSSARLSGYDYGAHGLYFVTICTKDRIRYFGEIEKQDTSEMLDVASLQATEIAKVAIDNWEKYRFFILMWSWMNS